MTSRCFFALLFFFGNFVTVFAAVERPLPEISLTSWRAERFCKTEWNDGTLKVNAVNGSPVLSCFCNEPGGQFRIAVEIQTQAESTVRCFWTTQGSPRRDDEKSQTLPLQTGANGQRYEFTFAVPDTLTSLAFQFSATEGTWEIKSLSLFCARSAPLSVLDAVLKTEPNPNGAEQTVMEYTIANNTSIPVSFRINHQTESISVTESQTATVKIPIQSEGNLDLAALVLHCDGFPDAFFPVFRYNPKRSTAWKTFKLEDGFEFDVDPKGHLARLRCGQDVFAVTAPLVHRNGVLPNFTLSSSTENSLTFESPDCTLSLQFRSRSVRFSLQDLAKDSPPLEGPCVRLLGTLHEGLLPGSEFLGQGDVSSSPIDLAEPLNQRDVPNPQWLTMPLAVLAAPPYGVTLQWNDPFLQPTFSSPNRFDKTDDSRVSLVGKNIEATVTVYKRYENESNKTEPVVLQALKRYVAENGLPAPPPAPRSSSQQQALNLSALETLRSPDGTRWGYALEPEWKREPFADFLSTQTRLTGKLPIPKTIVSGGSNIANDAVYFITGRAEEWLAVRKRTVRTLLTLQQPDGSFLLRTRFPEVERKATSYGFTAIRALELMEFVRLTGDKDLFAAVQKSLQYLDSCVVPRGGFYRDSPLHTPDLQTAATLVWLYCWAFEFSGEKRYLESAQRYAYYGLPFVYLWNPLQPSAAEKEDKENTVFVPALYTTVPKFGGTDRATPLWFGIARPETGIQYAYALSILSRYDKSVDWKRIAEGILHTAETMQYSEGPYAGCLPDKFDLIQQERQSWKGNPCALVSLRWVLEGKLDSLSLLTDERERYVSPYPLRLTSDGVEVYDIPDAVPSFQILRNGNRMETLNGSGSVVIP